VHEPQKFDVERDFQDPRRAALPIAIAVSAGGALIAGWRVDARESLTQSVLFWHFLTLGLLGGALGWALQARHERSALRKLVGALAALAVWRVAYFPLMVICGWLASVGEWLAFHALGRSVIYPTFLSLILAMNLVIAWIATAAFTNAQPDPGRGALARLLRQPPQKPLWGVGALALPVAAMVTFSKPSDLVPFGDRPWKEVRPIPEIHDPKRNPYEIILREREMELPAQVLAFNAYVTYPLVPEGPWGSAMKGTLEALALENPVATSQERIDEHYLAYLAAHARLHPRGRLPGLHS
jgi:hypothetical protein